MKQGLKTGSWDMLLKNKVILITGASRGIGRAVALALAKSGATCILLSRTIKDLELLYDEIIANGYPKPTICPFNLCNATPEDYDDLRRNIMSAHGHLDGLIHNAGILGTLTPIEYYNLQTWYKVLQVNLNSVFLLTQACIPLLKQTQNNSSIVFTLPTQASVPKANWGAYGVASAGCRALMQMLAAECQNITKIRVNAVEPKNVNTALRKEAYPGTPSASLLSPEAITEQYVYLMSDRSMHLNGQIFSTGVQQETALV